MKSAIECTFPACDIRTCDCTMKADMWLMRTGRHDHGAVSAMKCLELENSILKSRIEVMELIIQDYRETKR
jgi:hypothetical protein